jgi:hypothetical protein
MPRSEKERPIPPPKYSILKEEVKDLPAFTSITLRILVPQDATETELRTLLNDLYSSQVRRTGFKSEGPPDDILIFAYTSKERADGFQDIAHLLKQGKGLVPSININEGEIAERTAIPEQKFGLSEARRREIWNDYNKVLNRAAEEADQRYPLADVSRAMASGISPSECGAEINKRNKLYENLVDNYTAELSRRHGITLEQLKAIDAEAFRRDWTPKK